MLLVRSVLSRTGPDANVPYSAVIFPESFHDFCSSIQKEMFLGRAAVTHRNYNTAFLVKLPVSKHLFRNRLLNSGPATLGVFQSSPTCRASRGFHYLGSSNVCCTLTEKRRKSVKLC